jgi:hypothetical protein
MSGNATDTPNIAFLREQVDGLKRLLDDPHPGLSTWAKMYGDRMQALSNFWNAEEAAPLSKEPMVDSKHEEMHEHPDPRVRALIVNLCDALCEWERGTGRESVLILREQGGFSFRAVSGKPGVPDNIPDDQVMRVVLT